MSASALVVTTDSFLTTSIHDTALQRGLRAAFLLKDEDPATRLAEEGARLVIVDLDCPGLDAIEVIKALKADPRSREVPVVAISIHPDSLAWQRAREAGADQMLSRGEFKERVGSFF